MPELKEVKENKKSIAVSKPSTPKTKNRKVSRAVYIAAITILAIIALIVSWFALRTVFPKLPRLPLIKPPVSEKEVPPPPSLPGFEIEEEKPIETFEDVGEALEDLENRVGEIGELDPDLEFPTIDLDNLQPK